MDKPRLVTILSKLSLRYSYWKLGWPKPITMSYEGLFIEKGGVTLDIPLSDYSMIVTFKYWHLNFHLKRYIAMQIYPCETKWLEKAMQDITDTQTVVVRPTLWHPCDGWWRWNYAHKGYRPSPTTGMEQTGWAVSSIVCKGVQEHGSYYVHTCDPTHWYTHRGEDKDRVRWS